MSRLQELYGKNGITNYEQQQLSGFPDNVVMFGMSQLEKQTKPISNKLNWLLAVCKNRVLTKTDPSSSTIKQNPDRELKVSYNKKAIIQPPSPYWSRSYEDNLQMFNEWYVNHATECAEYHRKEKKFYANQFVVELDKRFSNPDEVKRINQQAKTFEEILMKFKPESNTTNEKDKVDILVDEVVKRVM